MTPSILGSALGALIGLTISGYALWVAQRGVSTEERASLTYPPPDWSHFARNAIPLTVFLAILHWLPEIGTKVAGLLNSSFVLNQRSYAAILFIGHALAITGVATGLLGLIWSSWHRSRTSPKHNIDANSGDA